MTPYEDDHFIKALTARYNRAADSGDLDAYADCFTPDGVFDIVAVVRVEGHEALKAMMGALEFPTHHATTDHVIEVDGDRATQTCSLLLFGRGQEANEMRLLTTSRYLDRLTRTPAGWRFSERVLTNDVDLGPILMEIHPPLVQALSAMAGA